MRDADRQASDIAWDWVAELYDTYVTTRLDVPFYLAQTASLEGEALELMCGTWRVSLPLAEAGVSLTCVDSSAGMLARLREKLALRPASAARVAVIQADVRDLTLDKRFSLALLPFHSFAELTAEDDQRQALARVAALLCEGGRFICPLHNPPIRRATLDGQLRLIGRFPQGAGQLHVWSIASYDTGAQLATGAQYYEEYDATGAMLRKRQLPIRFALLDHQRFEALARDAGFQVVALYGDYSSAPFDAETSPYQIWVLTI